MEFSMRKEKTSREKEIQEKINRLNKDIDACKKVQTRMEQIIKMYEDRLKDIDLLQETYESLISTHNSLIDQLMQKINSN